MISNTSVNNHIYLWNYASIKVVDVRHTVMKENEELSSYYMPTSGFIYSVRGSARVLVDGNQYLVNGMYLLHGGKGTRLDISLNEEFEYYLIFYKATISLPCRRKIICLLEEYQPFQLQYGFAPLQPVFLLDNVEKMIQEWRRSGRLEKFHAKTLFYSFVYKVLDQLQKQEINVAKPDLATQVIDYIQKHYKEPITLNLLSELFNHSTGNLAKVVKKRTGASPIDYVIQIRINKAKQLLLGTDLSIKEIADSVGYSDQFYFSRIFKKHSGYSPNRFKELSHKNRNQQNRPYGLRRSSIVEHRYQRYIDVCDNHYQYRGGELQVNNNWKGLALNLILCMTLLLSACSGNQATNAGNGNGNQPSSETNTQATTTAERSETVMKHKFGETVVPTEPKRVVSLGLEDMLLALDLPIVYATVHGEKHYLEDMLKEKGVQISAQWEGEVNYEAVLAAEPDLIIMSDGRDQATFDELSKIAPTICFNRENWQEEIVKLAQLIDDEENAKAILQTNEDHVENAEEAITKVVGEEATVAFLRVGNGQAYLWFPFPEDSKDKGYVGLIYDSVGLKPDPFILKLKEEHPEEKWGVPLSLEKLPELTADHIFVTAGASGGAAGDYEDAWIELEEIEQLHVWQQIPAVKQGNVHKVQAKHWMLAGPFADERKINDVVQALTK